MPEILNLLSPVNIIVFILVLTRLSGMFVSAPFFSTFNFPEQVKALFAASIAFIIFPVVAQNANFILPTSSPGLLVLVLLEFAIGFLIGFVANIVFFAARIAGTILSIQMSLSMAEVLDPATGEQSTAISGIYVYLATLVFFAINAHNWLFETLY
ncbi:flagellar biosynthetic protein FliR, partial [Candidatus Gastranaerophilus sp. (ex Termes propinquus)]